jgi:hypothetical protein
MTRSNVAVLSACCPLIISGTDQEQLVAMFKALRNPIRFEIIKFLVTCPDCITGDIVDIFADCPGDSFSAP